MKNNLLLTLFSVVCFYNVSAQYCVPIYTNGCTGNTIQNFSLKQDSFSVIRNHSGVCSTPYSYNSSASISLCKGMSYSGFIRTENNNNYISIWIDADNDSVFENNERILNNLKASTSDLLYSVYIPHHFATGTHRMRVRNIYSLNQPATTTDPCLSYSAGETEDYIVEITNTLPAPRYVANGVPGFCALSSRTTIDAASNNIMADSIQLMDSNNHPICAFVPDSVTFGTVYAAVYVHNGPTRQTPQGVYYMDRNYKFFSSVVPSQLFKLHLYYKSSELDSLLANTTNLFTLDSLSFYRNTDPCQAVLFDQNGTTFRNTFFTTQYAQVNGVPGSMGTYYIGLDTLGFTCAQPINLAVMLNSSTSVILSWSAGSSTTSSFQYVVNTSPVPPPIATNTSLNSIGISGLINGQLYYAHVRSKCGSVFSSWVTVSFTTILNDRYCNANNLALAGMPQCDNSTNADATGDPPLSCSSPNNTLWYKFSPAINGIYLFRLTTPGSNPLHGFMVWYESAGTCPLLNLIQLPTNNCNEFGQSGANDVDSIASPYLIAGKTYYIMIDGVSGDAGQFCIQALYHIPPPPCSVLLTPANSLSNIDNLTPITLSWSPSTGALSYDLYFGAQDPPPLYEPNLSSTSKTFQLLDYNTTYYWYVIPHNTGGIAQGCVSNRFQFATYNPPLCLPLYLQGCSYGDSLTYFSFKGEAGSVVYNSSGVNCNSTSLTSYTDYTSLFSPVNVAQGRAYSGFLRTGNQANYISIWIDQDDDLYYNDNECVLSNLEAGTSNLLYSIMIPDTIPVGLHRMRVRNVAYPQLPAKRTHACNIYEFGETEDYLINVVNIALPRAVAPGAPGQCVISSVTMIDSFSNNTLLFSGVSFLDSMNRSVGSIYPDQNNFGRTYFNYYVQHGNTRFNPAGKPYLNRNMHLHSSIEPTDSFGLRFNFRESELDSLLSHPASGVSSINDVGLLFNQDICSAAISNNPSGRRSAVLTGSGSGVDPWIDFKNLTLAKGFYLLLDCIPGIADTLVTICGSQYQWLGTTYTASGNYSKTYLNAKGCDSVLNLMLTLHPFPTAGIAFTEDSLTCVGKLIELEYESCQNKEGFNAYYALANWDRDTLGNSNASITSSVSNDSLIMVSSDGLSDLGQTTISIAAACDGLLSFDWHYSTVDGPDWDFPQYAINGSVPYNLPGFSNSAPGIQSGSFSLPLNKGDILQLQIWSLDNLFGPCTLIIDNFEAQVPYPSQHIVWYNDVAATDSIGAGNFLSVMADSIGSRYFYATIEDSSTNCIHPNVLSTNLVTIDSSCFLKLDLRLFLQGYYTEYLASNPSAPGMRSALFNQGVSSDSMIVDSIMVILYQPFPLNPVDTAFTVLSVQGLASCGFFADPDDYYVVIRHRHTIETWSAYPLSLWNQTTFYDFTTDSSSAYGNNLAEMPANRWALFAGDINQDENIDGLDLSLIESEISEFTFGYFSEDINGDSNIDLLDSPIIEKNVNDFIFAIKP